MGNKHYWKYGCFPFNFENFLGTPLVAASLKFRISKRKYCFPQKYTRKLINKGPNKTRGSEIVSKKKISGGSAYSGRKSSWMLLLLYFSPFSTTLFIDAEAFATRDKVPRTPGTKLHGMTSNSWLLISHVEIFCE